MTVTVHTADCPVAEQLDVGRLFDPPDQIAGHSFVQIIAADHEQHVAGMLGEKDGALAGRIATAHDHNLGPPAHLRLGESYGIVNPCPFEPFAPLHAQPAVVGSCSDQEALRCDGLAVVQVQDGIRLLEPQPGHGRGDRQTGTELVGLEDRAVGQIAPGQSGGKSEIVLNPHTAARLSAWSGTFQHHRP